MIVVTGKGEQRGREAPSWIDEPGVLRRLVPHWLREADMRAVVLGFEEAGRAHGGAGALYVRLRRRERAVVDRAETLAVPDLTPPRDDARTAHRRQKARGSNDAKPSTFWGWAIQPGRHHRATPTTTIFAPRTW